MSSIILCYIIYAVFLTVVGTLFFLYSRLSLQKVKRECEKEKDYIDAYNIAMKNVLLLDRLELRKTQKDVDKLEKYPNIIKYLQQNRAIVINPFTFDHLVLYKRNPEVAGKYVKEFESCKDTEIRNAVESTIQLVDIVYRQKSPVCSDKKKRRLHILPCVEAICDALIHMFEKSGNNVDNSMDKSSSQNSVSDLLEDMRYESEVGVKTA